MTTLFGNATQETGDEALSSREGKRNRKAQVLSALLSASALGVFLEACGDISTSTSSGRTCYADSSGYVKVPCSSSQANYYSYASPLAVASSDGAVALSIEGAGGDAVVASLGNTEQDGDAVVLLGGESSEELLGGTSDDLLEGLGDTDILDGSENADTLDGAESTETLDGGESGESVDTLDSGEGADTLDGGTGDDLLEGKGGDDLLTGGTGADTYTFAQGDGADTIVEVGEEGVVNTLRFEGDYEASDFSFSREGKDLLIVADTNGDGQAENEITLDGYFVSDTGEETAYSIEIQINNEEAFLPAVG